MGSLKTAPPAFTTGTLRYDFQIACARAAAPGIVLNVGCNEDPAQLRRRFGNRIINCDRAGYDDFMDRPNVVDRIFDALDFPWPFASDSVECVVLGDILEHFPIQQSIDVLTEAHRVSNQVCVTVPEDIRIDEAAELEKWTPGEYNLHTTVVTEEVLHRLFADSGWELDWVVRGLWGIGGEWGEKGVHGWCARGHRDKVEEGRLAGSVELPAGVEAIAAASPPNEDVSRSLGFARGGMIGTPVKVAA